MHKAVTADNYHLVSRHQNGLLGNDAPFGLSQDVSLFNNENTLMEPIVLVEPQRHAESQFNDRCESMKLQGSSSSYSNVYSQLVTSF